jgi:hypothetical protein
MKIIDIPLNVLIHLKLFFSPDLWPIQNEFFWFHLLKKENKNYPQWRLQEAYWRNFLNTTKELDQLKKETVYFWFNQSNSERYLKETMFHYYIQAVLLKNVNQQVGISLSNRIIPSGQIDAHFITVLNRSFSAADLWKVKNCEIVSFHGCNFHQFPGSDDFQFTRLKFSGCRLFSFVGTFFISQLHLNDISSLGTLETFSTCSSLRKLSIRLCPNLTSGLSVFKQLDSLCLHQQPLRDYSLVQNIFHLEIYLDPNLINLYDFYTSSALVISHCPNLSLTVPISDDSQDSTTDNSQAILEPKLKHFVLEGYKSQETELEIDHFPFLQTLTIACSPKLEKIILSSNVEMEKVEVNECQTVKQLEIQDCKKMKKLSVQEMNKNLIPFVCLLQSFPQSIASLGRQVLVKKKFG